MAMIGAAGIAAAGAVGGGMLSSSAAKSAAGKQSDAALAAMALQKEMFDQTRSDLAPYRNMGSAAINPLQALTGTNTSDVNLGGMNFSAADANPLTAFLTAPWNPTMESLEATPGYQFTKDQGLQAVNNKAASMGLGNSGPLLKSIGNYVTGLAATTWPQVGNFQLGQRQNIYNMLTGQINTGENAAAQTGSYATQVGNNLSGLMNQYGAAQASGIVGSANAMSNAANGVGNAASMYGFMNYMNPSTSQSPFGNLPIASGAYGNFGAGGYQPDLNYYNMAL